MNFTSMIVDPMEDSASELKCWLEEKKIEVLAWHKKGAGWMRPYSQRRPHLVFFDLLLPERDGIYCINKLVRQDPSATCILLHSYEGNLANEIELKAFKAGAAAVLQRPIEKKRFEAMIMRFSERVARERARQKKSP